MALLIYIYIYRSLWWRRICCKIKWFGCSQVLGNIICYKFSCKNFYRTIFFSKKKKVKWCIFFSVLVFLYDILAGIWLWERNCDNEHWQKKNTLLHWEGTSSPQKFALLNKLSNNVINVIGFDVCSYRRSSGFSRGVSKYRGVAR